MADDLDLTQDDRAVELSAISAIYPELVINSTNPFSASIDIAVEPVKPLAILFVPPDDEVSRSGLLTPSMSDDMGNQMANEVVYPEHEQRDRAIQDIHHVSYLPPLTLDVELQDGYPSERPPLFHLKMNTPWIPRTKMIELQEVGSSIWEDMGRDQVVFSYIDYLREAAERNFDLVPKDGVYLEVSQSLKIELLDFDLRLKRAKFEQETFECGVCLGMFKGVTTTCMLLNKSYRTEEGSSMSSFASMLPRVLCGMSSRFL
jgi:E3 ubiquitin-protein ligase RNF14